MSRSTRQGLGFQGRITRGQQPEAPGQGTVRTKPPRSPAPKAGAALGKHLRRLAEASGAMDPRLAEAWPTLAGPDVAKLCQPVRIVRQGKVQALEVSVKSNAAALRVQYAQEALLGRLRTALGMPSLTKLVFREGQARRGWERRRVAAPPAASREERLPAVKASGTAPHDASPNRNKQPNTKLKAALDSMRQSMEEGKS